MQHLVYIHAVKLQNAENKDSLISTLYEIFVCISLGFVEYKMMNWVEGRIKTEIPIIGKVMFCNWRILKVISRHKSLQIKK